MGARKTYILHMLGVIEQVIVLIFIPLLMLLADVISKFTCANQRFSAVIIQHLDKLYDAYKQAYKVLLEQCQGLLWSTLTTVFILLSPQFIINHSDAQDIFIECSHCVTLRVVDLDEANIYVQHGMPFHWDLCSPSPVFVKLFGNQPHMTRPRLISLTATMPTSYLPPVSNFLTINSFSGDSLVCGTQSKFEQWEIEMQSCVTSNKGQYVSEGLTLVSQFLRDNPSATSAVVICNSRKHFQHLWDQLERKLNELKLNFEVMHINGTHH